MSSSDLTYFIHDIAKVEHSITLQKIGEMSEADQTALFLTFLNVRTSVGSLLNRVFVQDFQSR